MKIVLHKILAVILEFLREPSRCTEAALTGAVVFIIVYICVDEPHDMYAGWAALVCTAGTVLSHSVNGFRPRFCMNREESNLDKELRRT